MPLHNEHAARLKNPDVLKDETYKRTSGGKWVLPGAGITDIPKTIDVISGELKGQTGHDRTAQSLHFPIVDWTAEQAREWLKTNNISNIGFEEAIPMKTKPMSDMEKKLIGRLGQMLLPKKAVRTVALMDADFQGRVSAINGYVSKDLQREIGEKSALLPALKFFPKIQPVSIGQERENIEAGTLADIRNAKNKLKMDNAKNKKDRGTDVDVTLDALDAAETEVLSLIAELPTREQRTASSKEKSSAKKDVAEAEKLRIANERLKLQQDSKTPEAQKQSAAIKAEVESAQEDADRAKRGKEIDDLWAVYQKQGMDAALFQQIKNNYMQVKKDATIPEIKQALNAVMEKQEKIVDALKPKYDHVFVKEKQADGSIKRVPAKVPVSEINKHLMESEKQPGIEKVVVNGKVVTREVKATPFDTKGGLLDQIRAKAEAEGKVLKEKNQKREELIKRTVDLAGEPEDVVRNKVFDIEEKQEQAKITELPKTTAKIEELKKKHAADDAALAQARQQIEYAKRQAAQIPLKVKLKMGHQMVPNPEYQKAQARIAAANARLVEKSKGVALLRNQVAVMKQKKARIEKPVLPSDSMLTAQIVADKTGSRNAGIAAVAATGGQNKVGTVETMTAKLKATMDKDNIPADQQQYVLSVIPDWTEAYARMNLMRMGEEGKIATAMKKPDANVQTVLNPPKPDKAQVADTVPVNPENVASKDAPIEVKSPEMLQAEADEKKSREASAAEEKKVTMLDKLSAFRGNPLIASAIPSIKESYLREIGDIENMIASGNSKPEEIQARIDNITSEIDSVKQANSASKAAPFDPRAQIAADQAKLDAFKGGQELAGILDIKAKNEILADIQAAYNLVTQGKLSGDAVDAKIAEFKQRISNIPKSAEPVDILPVKPEEIL